MNGFGGRYPLISIIVPVYNIMEYLPRCVESLRQQTYPNLEILLVDDGSTDGTGLLCDELGRQDERIRVFHKENGGSSSARNYGISKAQGAYLGFVDSDDYVDREMYEILYEAIEKYGVRAAQVGRDEVDPSGNRLPDICIPPKQDVCIPPEKFMEELLMHRGDCSFCTKLLSREVFDRHFPEGVLNEDFHLLVQLLQMFGYGLFLPASVYYVNENVPAVDRVRGQAIMMMASTGLGGVFGNVIAGRIIDFGGVDGLIIFCIGSGVIGTLLALAALQWTKRKNLAVC